MSPTNPLTFKAVILDMDGVITQTAQVHAKAWKQMFDELLEKWEGTGYKPLSIKEDYRKYIDGKPRLDGLRSFLESRDIMLPEGKTDDKPYQETIYGLGARKNNYFLEILDNEGVQVYQDAKKVVTEWKEDGIKLAVVSSSSNCRYVMEATGILQLFDARIDGQLLKEKQLNGKPEPDVFLEACKMLEVKPSETIVIEDAIVGVQAGRKGNFKCVIGVARNGQEEALKKNGADIIVHKLTDIKSEMEKSSLKKDPETLKHANESFNEIKNMIGKKKPAFFLDYDGTLSPIVKNPEDAILSEKAKNVLQQLAKDYTVALVSGRDRADVKGKVGMEDVYYAGSHGFDITGPNKLEMQYEGGVQALPALDAAEKNLQQKLKNIDGVKVERKKYAIAVHFRNVAEAEVPAVKSAVYEELEQQQNLKKGGGKMILELKPDIDWHKGRAILWLMDALELKGEQYIPLFIGDDATDEDALEAIADNGIGILVGLHGEKTAANYRLNDPDEVVLFLEQIQKMLTE